MRGRRRHQSKGVVQEAAHLLPGLLDGGPRRHVRGRGRGHLAVKHLVGGGRAAGLRRQVQVRVRLAKKTAPNARRLATKRKLAIARHPLSLSHRVGHVLESRELPVGGAVVHQQPVLVRVGKASGSGRRPSPPGGAPPSGWTKRTAVSHADLGTSATTGTARDRGLGFGVFWLAVPDVLKAVVKSGRHLASRHFCRSRGVSLAIGR